MPLGISSATGVKAAERNPVREETIESNDKNLFVNEGLEI